MKNRILTLLLIAALTVVAVSTYKIVNKPDHYLNPILTSVQKTITKQEIDLKEIEVLTDEIREVGKIKVLETVENVPYSDIQKDKIAGFTYRTRGINASLYYNVDFEYDLENIEVQKIDDTITIILTDDINITVSYDVQKSNMKSATSILAEEYTAEEINAIIYALQERVLDKVVIDSELYERAYTSLERVLRGIGEKMGIENIIIEGE